jgi:hypothetical protein
MSPAAKEQAKNVQDLDAQLAALVAKKAAAESALEEVLTQSQPSSDVGGVDSQETVTQLSQPELLAAPAARARRSTAAAAPAAEPKARVTRMAAAAAESASPKKRGRPSKNAA